MSLLNPTPKDQKELNRLITRRYPKLVPMFPGILAWAKDEAEEEILFKRSERGALAFIISLGCAGIIGSAFFFWMIYKFI